ncbi:MAG: FAD-dependent oxidoreductase, partial [Cyanobacteria bacterium J06642_11]
MIINAAEINDAEIKRVDICIVGTGPAGLTLARELAHLPVKVCLLESGDTVFKEETQSLYAGEIKSAHYPHDELVRGRCRQLGGTSNFWEIQVDEEDVAQGAMNVRHVIPDAIDFEKREEIPYSGWPFQRPDLMPYYERAHQICQIGPLDYSPTTWETAHRHELTFGDERVESRIFQFGRSAVFFQGYTQELNHAENIDIYTNAHVLELLTNEADRAIEKVKVAITADRAFWVVAKTVVLATGGIENARLLLMSRSTRQAGIGNECDLVGRFFMDHPGTRFGIFKPHSSELFNFLGLYDLHRVRGTALMAKLAFSEKVLRRHRLNNFCLSLMPKIKGLETQSVVYFRRFTQGLRKREFSRKTAGFLKQSLPEFS